MVECEFIDEHLDEFLNGTLSEEDAEKIGAHRACCEDCDDRYRRAAAFWKATLLTIFQANTCGPEKEPDAVEVALLFLPKHLREVLVLRAAYDEDSTNCLANDASNDLPLHARLHRDMAEVLRLGRGSAGERKVTDRLNKARRRLYQDEDLVAHVAKQVSLNGKNMVWISAQEDCDYAEDHLHHYSNGDAEGRVLAHLAVCPSCRRLYDNAEAFWDAFWNCLGRRAKETEHAIDLNRVRANVLASVGQSPSGEPALQDQGMGMQDPVSKDPKAAKVDASDEAVAEATPNKGKR